MKTTEAIIRYALLCILKPIIYNRMLRILTRLIALATWRVCIVATNIFILIIVGTAQANSLS